LGNSSPVLAEYICKGIPAIVLQINDLHLAIVGTETASWRTKAFA